MTPTSPGKNLVTRVLRNGHPPDRESNWDHATPEQRIEAVWDLTLLCLAWQPKQADEPIAVLSKGHLIKNKRAAGRTQDLADVERLVERDKK